VAGAQDVEPDTGTVSAMSRPWALVVVSVFTVIGIAAAAPAVTWAAPDAPDTAFEAVAPTPLAPEPNDLIPVDSIIPNDSVPDTSVPDDSVPDTSIPDDSIPNDSIPDESIPDESIPVESIPDLVQQEGNTAQPALAPRVSSSDIPLGSIVLALLVLAGVGVASFGISRRSADGDRASDGEPNQSSAAPPLLHDAVANTSTLEFLLELGESLIDAGDAVNHVESTLRAVARANGIVDIGVLVLPTALIVSLPDGGGNVMTEVGGAGRDQLRLDQVDDVLALVAEAERGGLGAVEGRQRLATIRAAAPPYPSSLALFGYVCSTVGLAVILRATWIEALIAGVLGAVIGALRLSTRLLDRAYQPFVPLIAATAVSVSVFTVARIVDDLVTFPLLVAPLVTFLPGALLTIAVFELATGQIVAGASRLASGALQLLLLAVGIVAGGQLVGVPAGDLRSGGGGWIATIAPWIGVAVFGVGAAMFRGARRAATSWILLVLYVAYAGQVIGGLFFGSALSAFFGALAMTPVAVLAARQRSGPASLVTLLTGFWILVPGALGLEGASRLLGEGDTTAIATLVTTVTSMVGISLGILLGLTVVADDPQRPWAQTRRR
jgi:uncharacterized membrane protein YjjP (DUF1212 family)